MVLATECTLAVEPLFGAAKGVRGNLPPPRHARTLFLPMLTALGARVCRVETPPAKEPEAGAGRKGAASWVQHEQCACPVGSVRLLKTGARVSSTRVGKGVSRS